MERASIVGPVLMVRLTGSNVKYRMTTNIRTADEVYEAVGFGNDLRECWLDMFAAFNDAHANTYVVNGRLKGHEIKWLEII